MVRKQSWNRHRISGRCKLLPDIRRGLVSDIKNIADSRADGIGIPLIVDEAHGAHFEFSPEFPENATRLGGDAGIMSVPKALPDLPRKTEP